LQAGENKGGKSGSQSVQTKYLLFILIIEENLGVSGEYGK
jgi:hypothetical protein